MSVLRLVGLRVTNEVGSIGFVAVGAMVVIGNAVVTPIGGGVPRGGGLTVVTCGLLFCESMFCDDHEKLRGLVESY